MNILQVMLLQENNLLQGILSHIYFCLFFLSSIVTQKFVDFGPSLFSGKCSFVEWQFYV